MAQLNVDLGILKETKITNGVCSREFNGFCVVVSDAPSHHHKFVSIFYK